MLLGQRGTTNLSMGSSKILHRRRHRLLIRTPDDQNNYVPHSLPRLRQGNEKPTVGRLYSFLMILLRKLLRSRKWPTVKRSEPFAKTAASSANPDVVEIRGNGAYINTVFVSLLGTNRFMVL